MIQRKKENGISLEDLGFRHIVPCPGHGGYDDFTVRELPLYSFQKREGAEDFSHGGGMHPDGVLEDKRGQEPYSLSQHSSIPFLKKGSQKEIRGGKDQEERNQCCVKDMSHLSGREGLIEIMVGPLGQVVKPLLQEEPFFFKMIAVSMKIHGDRLSVNEDSF
jgi:hypothetical protein